MIRFINDATVDIPRVDINITRCDNCYSDNDIYMRDYDTAFNIYKYFDLRETFMVSFGSEYTRNIAWNASKGNDTFHAHDSAFYNALLNALENPYFDVAQDIHDIVYAIINEYQYIKDVSEKSLKPFDVEIFEYNGLRKKVIWQHSYR